MSSLFVDNRTELWHALDVRTQSKTEITIDYFNDKIQLLNNH